MRIDFHSFGQMVVSMEDDRRQHVVATNSATSLADRS